jgi:futalosine hydrolase
VADGARASGGIALLAAFEPELAPLARALSLAAPAGAALGGRVGEVGIFAFARAVGIGLPAAAVGAARALTELRPRAAVLVGTCGAYARSGLAIGDVVVSRRVHLADAIALAGHAAFPEPMLTLVEAHGGLVERLARTGARPVDVAATLGITVDDGVASRLEAATGAAVEHLEAYGVAEACAAHGVPFAAVLGVANAVGARARSEWLAHHVRAAEACAGTVAAWLSALSLDEAW